MSILHLRMRLFSFAVLGCLSGLSSAVAAPSPTPGEQDLIRERQNRLLEQQQRRLDELKELPGKTVAPTAPSAPVDSRCFPIRQIVINGADHLSESDRKQATQPYEGQCLGTSQLNELLKVITHRYIDKGLVTSRAYLPQQDLSDGQLRVLIVEGHLEKLQVATPGDLSARELAMSFPGREGELLNLREIEQMVDQLNRLPSNQTQMELTPGQAPGGSDVVVKNTPQKPWRASLSRSNGGQVSTGEQQWDTSLDWDSPLGLADQLMLRGSHDAVSDHQRSSSSEFMNYNLPWGWWNFNYSYSQSDYRSQAQAYGFGFKQTGDSQNHQLRAERVVHRDAVSKTLLNIGLNHLRTNNFIEDTKLKQSSNRISEAQFGFNHGRRIGSAFVNLDLGMQNGIGAFDAQSDHDPRPGEPTARYRKYTATLSYLQPFTLWGESLIFSSLATGQRSEDVLFSSQRMSLGGQGSIRGYKQQSLSGDSGGYWRNDLRWSRQVTWPWLRPVLAEYGTSLGYDHGVIQNDRYNGDQHGRVSGNSLELFARGEHLATSVTFAHSLERPNALTEHEAPIYFSLSFFL
ncbi:ShlB/FhaC/HecB family hemolysin secretion/activation protein [Pseudomonas sp. ANT_H12B]|uniref:ShlB/FhaC/HecB family hemolysin secretion/activation protein n=1 Tax=Pseudomonas sp. ANT_H12B TaxID=2597348 RepID=UPI0011EBDF63|nr:ShlB/FhaC/HecB family hemolysin secretion/activation protein [Pseudomonas sp. ANT_H12B]